MLNVIILKCRYAECHTAECRGAIYATQQINVHLHLQSFRQKLLQFHTTLVAVATLGVCYTN
jgi:hypothetical protein